MTVATDTIKGTYLVEGQAQKEARSNEWFDQLALNLAGYLSKDVAGAGTVTLTDTVGGEAHHATLRFTGALTGDRTVIVPSAERVYFAGNLTTGSFTLTVTTADGSGAVIPQASWLILVCDGVNVTAPAFTSGSSVPPASETVAGLVELATAAETTTGTDTTRAVTPAGLAAKLPAGTPLSVVRYAASGTTLETGSATVVLDAAGRLGVGQATPLYPLHVVGELRLEQGFMRAQRDVSPATIQSDVAGDGVNSAYGYLSMGRSRGSFASRTPVQSGDRLGLVTWSGHTGTALSFGVQMEGVAEEAFSTTTLGTRLTVSTAQLGTATLTERLRLDSQGRVGVHTTLSATLGSGASYQPLTVKGSQLLVGQSSVQERPMTLVESTWATSTDASRKARLTLSVYDATAAREGLRIEASGTAPLIGFLGAAAVARPAVTGSRGGNAALASALSALASLGLITDSSSA
jgi:hypothetical protein